MNIEQLRKAQKNNPELKNIYPDISLVGGNMAKVVQFHPSPPRYLLAKEFGMSNCLVEENAKTKLSELRKSKKWEEITIAEWNEIGVLEGLPLYEPTPPEVEEKIQKSIASASTAGKVFEQNFVETVNHVLDGALAQDNLSGGSNTFTLLEGRAGAAKSMSINFVAGVLKRPMYTFDCSGRSPDIVHSELIESIEIVGHPGTTAKDLAYIGGLTEPSARRAYLSAFKEYEHFKAIPLEEWDNIAKKQGLVQSTPYKKPGIIPRAMKYGGLLNLEELNALTGESLSLLNAELDVYRDRHPNFYVAASMNPAGEDYDNRKALPPDIRNRFIHQKEMTPPDARILKTLLEGLLCNKKPQVVNKGVTKVISAEDYGLLAPLVEQEDLLKDLTKESKDTLLNNLVKFYGEVEGNLSSGVLDPRTSSYMETEEQRVLSFRNLATFVNHFTCAIPHEEISFSEGSTLWDSITEEESELTVNDYISAIEYSLERSFVEPLSFLANPQEVAIEGRATQEGPVSTRHLLNDLLTNCGLTASKLSDYLETNLNIAQKIEKLEKACKAKNLTWPKEVQQDLETIMKASNKESFIISHENKSYSAGTFGNVDDMSQSIHGVHEKMKRNSIQVQNLTPQNLKEIKPQLNEYLNESGRKGIYVIPFINNSTKKEVESAYIVIPSEIGNDIKEGGFKVVVVESDNTLKKDSPEWDDNGILKVHSSTHIDSINSLFREEQILKNQMHDSPFFTVPFFQIDLEPRTKKKEKQLPSIEV